jgi:chaperonin GroES
MAKDECRVRPLGNRVLVKPDVDEKTAGGIFLTDQAKEDCRRGIIVAVGQGVVNKEGGPRSGFQGMYLPMPAGIEVGAVILYGRYAKSDTKGIDELKGHIIVDVDSILGVVQK